MMAKRTVYLEGTTLSMTDDEIVTLYYRSAPDIYAIQNLEDYLRDWRDDEAFDPQGKFKLLDFDLGQWREDHARKYTVMVSRQESGTEPESHFNNIWSAYLAAYPFTQLENSPYGDEILDVYIDCFVQQSIEGRTEWIFEYYEDFMFAENRPETYMKPMLRNVRRTE